jgi:hypothetical protein
VGWGYSYQVEYDMTRDDFVESLKSDLGAAIEECSRSGPEGEAVYDCKLVVQGLEVEASNCNSPEEALASAGRDVCFRIAKIAEMAKVWSPKAREFYRSVI